MVALILNQTTVGISLASNRTGALHKFDGALERSGHFARSAAPSIIGCLSFQSELRIKLLMTKSKSTEASLHFGIDPAHRAIGD
jgi:hypothetical protein